LRFGRPNKEPRHELTEQLAAVRVELAKRTGERDSLHGQVALKQAEIVQLLDGNRRLEASLSGVREQLRQAQRELERNTVSVTAEGLGAAMERMRQLRLPGPRDGEVGA